MRIGWIGDSQTEGLAPHLAEALSAYGIELAHLDFQRGWSTFRYMASGRLERQLAQWEDVDAIVVALGGNDATDARSQDPRIYKRWLARAAGAVAPRKLVWVGPTSTNTTADFAARRTKVSRIQRRLFGPFRFVDAAPRTPRSHLRDGLHLDRGGYRIFAAALAPTVARKLKPLWPKMIALAGGVGLGGAAGYGLARV